MLTSAGKNHGALAPAQNRCRSVGGAMSAKDNVAADLRRRLEIGEWRPQERIAPIDQLERDYPFSRMTIAKGVRQLVAEGLLRSRGKAGTWVQRLPGKGRVGILSNYQFESPGQAQFAHCLTQSLVKLLAAAGKQATLYQESTQGDWLISGTPNDRLMEDLGNGAIAGLLTVASNLPEWFRRDPRRRFAVPMVDISWHPSRHRVYIDFAAAAEMAVQILASAGRHRVAMLGEPQPGVAARFQRAASSSGLAFCPEFLDPVPAAWRQAEAYGYERMLNSWRSAKLKPDALFVWDDVVAKGVCQAALRLGISVPDKLLLLIQANEGIDYFYPCPVQRLEMPLPAMADAAVSMLWRLIENPHLPPEEKLFSPISVEKAQGIQALCEVPA